MRTIRTASELWLLGNAGLLASLALPPPVGTVVQGLADVVCAVAWIMAIVRACKGHEWRWALAIAVFPLAVWAYIFWRHAEIGPQPSQPTPVTDQPPRPVYTPPGTWEPDEPLAVRQAREAIQEAEWRFPDW